MRFGFTRRYSFVVCLFIVLTTLSFLFYYIGPKFIEKDANTFNWILCISLIDTFLICIFVLGLDKVNYYLYHDHILIKRSFRSDLKLKYSDINSITKNVTNHTFLSFMNKHEIIINYNTTNSTTKKRKIFVENHKLFNLVLENEKNIQIITNK